MIWFKSMFLCAIAVMIIAPALSDPVPISAKDSSAKKSNTRHDHSGPPANVLRNAPFVYRGPVFIVQETEDLSEPYIAQIVEGGIEMVQPINLKSFRKPLPSSSTNDSVLEIQDDPEYFAVLVTPETVAQAQISRSTTITIPLPILLLGVSSRIPWVMVLKRHNHFDYFRNLTPVHVPLPVRRRNRSQKLTNARLLTESRNYDLVYTEDDQNVMNGICASILQELVFLNSVMQNLSNETEPYNLDPFEQPSDKETSTTPKMLDKNLGNAKTSEDLPLEKFLHAMSSMVNDNTQPTTTQSFLKKQIPH